MKCVRERESKIKKVKGVSSTLSITSSSDLAPSSKSTYHHQQQTSNHLCVHALNFVFSLSLSPSSSLFQASAISIYINKYYFEIKRERTLRTLVSTSTCLVLLP